MKRTAAFCMLAGVVAACSGGNPFDETVEGGDTSEGSVFASEFDDLLSLNNVTYSDGGTPADPTDDTLLLNNIPFDNSDASGGEYTRAGALPNGFDRYESPFVVGSDNRQYFAVFRRTNFSQAIAVGSGEFIGPGFGGAAAQRLGAGGVPAERASSYVFTGEYAGVREGSFSDGAETVELVTGDANLTVDILDFDVTGAVDGTITNRQLFDQNGNSLGTLNDFISLTTAEIDFTTATVNDSQLVNQSLGGDQLGTGNWQAVFAGPNGEEITGIVVLDATIDTSATPGAPTGTVREVGAFIAVNNG